MITTLLILVTVIKRQNLMDNEGVTMLNPKRQNLMDNEDLTVLNPYEGENKEITKIDIFHYVYETIKPYELKQIDIPLNHPNATPNPKLKADKIKGKIILDEITTLENVPKLAFEYKLGNRSALE